MNNSMDKLIISLICMGLKVNEQKEISKYFADTLVYENDNYLDIIFEKFPNVLQKFENNLIKNSIIEKIDKWQNQKIKFLLLGTNDYPKSLSAIYNPPLVIFYLGNWKNNYSYENSVAIVGSRKAQMMQTKFVNELATTLSLTNICIVSGLAQGIDAAAHIGAINATNNPLPTIAVLGSGVNHIYPTVHKYLAQKILDSNGIILSQFLPDTMPFPYNFLDRNRIISGLSRIVIVAQAAIKSGALSTARYALEQGRELLSVLGPVYDEGFAGSNNLITEGALPIASIKDFFKLYPEYLKDALLDNKEDTISDPQEKTVYKYIKQHKKVSREMLSNEFKNLNLPLIIMSLEATSYIETLPGEEYVVI